MGCLAGSTDPSNTLVCNTSTPAVLASGQPVNTQPLKPTPIVNQFLAPYQAYQANTGFKMGGVVRGYAGGGSPVNSNPVTSTETGNELATAGVPTAQSTACSAAQIQNTMQKNATGTEGLTACETLTPALIKNTSCQELSKCAAPTVNATPVAAQTAGCAQQAQQANCFNASTYCAKTVHCQTPQMTGAKGTVCSNSLVSNQIAQLTSGLQCYKPGQTLPAWAQPAWNTANADAAARGLGTSSIAAGSEVAALEQAALPIAEQNATAYQNMNMANLNNEQQAAVQNQQSLTQTLLSDQSAVNAAAQFNATSQNQVKQFLDNLHSQIDLSNAAQVNAMKQFNAGQINSVAEFNANLSNNVAQFNSANQLAIAQNNVTWRRNINTLNTAAVNSAMQTNAQNLYNLTTTAQNNLWNQWQDQASWANTDSQNALTRAQNMAIASLGQQTAFNLADQAQQTALMQLLGKFGLSVAGGPVSNLLCTFINSSKSCSNFVACNSNSTPLGCLPGFECTTCSVLVCGVACSPTCTG